MTRSINRKALSPAARSTASDGGMQQGPVLQKLRTLKVEKLELSQAATRALQSALAYTGSTGPARPGRVAARGAMAGAVSAGGGGSAAAAGGALQGAGASTVIPVLGLSLGAAGAALKLLSSGAGMYQNLMQGQQGTLGTMQYLRGGGTGLFVPGGANAEGMSQDEIRRRANRYVRNAELARIYSARARLSESGHDTGGGMTGVKFGLAQGIGGLGGASLFAELGRYGTGGGSKLRRLFGAAELAGMGGLRQAEYFRTLSGMAAQGAGAGFGRMDLHGVGSVMAGLGQGGLMGERALALTRSMHGQLQSKGSLLHNLATVSALGAGKPLVEAMAQAERGATKGNVRGISELLGLDAMDDETRQLLEMNIFGATATDALRARGGIARAATSVGDVQLARTGGRELAQLERSVQGQDYIGTQNAMDAIASTLDQSFELQQKVAHQLSGVMGTVAKAVDGLAAMLAKIEGLL